MAFFNTYSTYQNPYYQQQTQPMMQAQPVMQTPTTHTGIVWVQGEAGAKSYLVAPNTTVQLWDSEAQVIYLKSADASGMPSIKTLDYTIRDNQQAQAIPQVVDTISREEFDSLKNQLIHLQNELHAMKGDAGNE